MFLLTVTSIIVLLQNVESGYNYPRSGVRSELASNKHRPGVQGHARGIPREYKSLDGKKISYSVPYRYYDLMQQHRNGRNANYFRNSPYQNGFNRILTKSNTNIGTSAKILSSDRKRFIVNNPNIVYGSPKISQSPTLRHHQQLPIVRYRQHSGPQEFNVNNVQQTLHRFVPNIMNANHNVPSHLNLQNILPSKVNFGPQLSEHFRKQPIFFNPQSIPNVLQTHDQNIQSVAPLFNIPNDFSPQQTPQVNENIDSSLKNLNNLVQPVGDQNNVPPPPPVVTKHIYFHVPPPDIEETSVAPTPSKKSIKIIFIKVPSQESRNIEELQTAYNSLGPIEDKTLIYVLSNNSEESSQLLVPAYKPSEHEVLFVKYNDNQDVDSDENLTDEDNPIYNKR